MSTLDEVARQLRDWRVAAGSPSFSDLARGVGTLRAGGAAGASRLAPGRVTVYDCFRDGRRRIDVDLAVDLARVLGVEGAELADWRLRCAEAMRPPAEHGLVTASSVVPEPVAPSIDSSPPVHGRRVLLAGMGGSGKTQAALRLLARWRAEGVVDGLLTLRLDGPAARADALVHAAAHELGAHLPADPEAAAARLLTLLARRRTALLVDDLAAADQIAPLVQASSEVPLVATSRLALDVPGLERVDLEPWTTAEATAYLRAVVGAERVDAEPEAARDLAGLSGGLPLVSALVAARVRAAPEWSLADHAATLRERRAGDRVEDAVRASMDATVDGLSTSARSILRLLASGPRSGLRRATLAALVGEGREPDRALAELAAAYLVDADDNHPHLHDVARVSIRGRAADEEPPRVRAEREDRILDRLLAEAWGVSAVLTPGNVEARLFDRALAPVEDAHAWLSVDLPGALELARAARGRRPMATIELSEALGAALEHFGLSQVSEQLTTEGLETARLLGLPLHESRARCILAVTAIRQGRPEVDLEGVTALAEGAEDTMSLVRMGNLRGIVAMRAGRQDEGWREFRAAYELAAEAGHDTLRASTATNLAQVLAGAGDLDGALGWCEVAVGAARERGHQGTVAQALSSLSSTQRLMGRYADAAASARAAVDEAEQMGDQFALAQALIVLGGTLTVTGEPGRAVAALERAEAIAGDIGLDEVEAALHTGIGEALVALGRPAAASQRFHAALAGHHDSPLDPATALHQLGRLAAGTDPERAARLYDEALAALGDGFERLADQIRVDQSRLAQR